MFIPFLTKRSPKGGGEGESSSSKASKGSSESESESTSFKLSKTKWEASSSSAGGGKPSEIPKGEPFSGRYIGGGTRKEIFGTNRYGSGYPGLNTTGVQGRNFPFGFEPLVFVDVVGALASLFALAVEEYGLPQSADRFGGPLAITMFRSKAYPDIYYDLYADTSSVAAVIPKVNSNCSTFVVAADANPVPVYSNDSSSPSPQQVVQYFRSSSAAILLPIYNNTAAVSSNLTALNTPLPGNIDLNLLECLNVTIARSIPIIDEKKGLPPWAIGLITFAAVIAVVVIVIIYCFVSEFKRCCSNCRRAGAKAKNTDRLESHHLMDDINIKLIG